MGTSIIGGQASELGWTYIKTVTVTTSHTLTIASLPAYEQYYIVGHISNGSVLGSGNIVLNGDTGANYSGNYVASTSVATYTGAASATNAFCYTTISKAMFQMFIQGMTSASAGGKLNANCILGCFEGGWTCFRWAGGNATQLTSILFTGGGAHTFDAELEVYGRNQK